MEMPGAPRALREQGRRSFGHWLAGCLTGESEDRWGSRRLAGRRVDLRRVDLALRKSRDTGVAAHDRLALLERQHVVDVGEAVRRALLDRVDDALRPAAAIHLHDLRGRWQPLLLVLP